MFPIQFHFRRARVTGLLMCCVHFRIYVSLSSLSFTVYFFSYPLSGLKELMVFGFRIFSLGIGFGSNPFLVCHEINQYVRVNVLSLCKIRSIWTMSHWASTLFIIYSVDRNRLGYGPTRIGRLWVSMGKSLPEKLKLQVTKINYNHFGVRFGNFNLIWPLRPSRELDHHGSHTVIPRTRTRISISLRDCTKLIFSDEHKKSHQKAIS